MSKAYFARDALSNSGIKKILINPQEFYYWTHNRKDPTAAFRMGQAFHQDVLEPHNQKFAIFSETKTFQSKAGAAFLAQWSETHICLTAEEHIEVCAWSDALHRRPKIISLIDSCDKEVEIYGHEPTSHGPIDTKAMADAINDAVIYDLKTTDGSAADFPYTARKYQYDIQAPWYVDRAFVKDGKLRRFVFIVVEKNPPYGVLLWEAGEKFMNDGRIKIASAVESYGRCKALNQWPSYDIEMLLNL